jgi:hypothetical protein
MHCMAHQAVSKGKVPHMTDPTPNPFRYGPTRGELWFWLVASVAVLALLAFAFLYRGLPGGPALIELVGLPILLCGYLGGRSVKRLIRREHP